MHCYAAGFMISWRGQSNRTRSYSCTKWTLVFPPLPWFPFEAKTAELACSINTDCPIPSAVRLGGTTYMQNPNLLIHHTALQQCVGQRRSTLLQFPAADLRCNSMALRDSCRSVFFFSPFPPSGACGGWMRVAAPHLCYGFVNAGWQTSSPWLIGWFH